MKNEFKRSKTLELENMWEEGKNEMGMNRKTGEDFDVFLSFEHIFIIIRIRMDTESAIVTDYDGR